MRFGRPQDSCDRTPRCLPTQREDLPLVHLRPRVEARETAFVLPPPHRADRERARDFPADERVRVAARDGVRLDFPTRRPLQDATRDLPVVARRDGVAQERARDLLLTARLVEARPRARDLLPRRTTEPERARDLARERDRDLLPVERSLDLVGQRRAFMNT